MWAIISQYLYQNYEIKTEKFKRYLLTNSFKKLKIKKI